MKLSKSITLLVCLCALTASAVVIRFGWAASADAQGYTMVITPCQPRPTTNIMFVIELDPTNAADVEVPGGSWGAMLTAWNTNNPQGIRIESSAALYGPFSVPDNTRLAANISAPFVPPVLALSSNGSAVATVWIQVSTNLTEWSDWLPTVDMLLGDGPHASYRTCLSVRKL